MQLEICFCVIKSNVARAFLRVSSPDSGLHSSSAPGSTDPTAEEPGHKFWDELGQIGLPDGVNVESLFDPTGELRRL